MNRNQVLSVFLSLLLYFCAGKTVLATSTEADFKGAVSAAEAAEKEAGSLKNRWTTTEQALAAARKAAATGDFESAVKHAQQAEALAKASIAQAREQETAWRSAVIH